MSHRWTLAGVSWSGTRARSVCPFPSCFPSSLRGPENPETPRTAGQPVWILTFYICANLTRILFFFFLTVTLKYSRQHGYVFFLFLYFSNTVQTPPLARRHLRHDTVFRVRCRLQPHRWRRELQCRAAVVFWNSASAARAAYFCLKRASVQRTFEI